MSRLLTLFALLISLFVAGELTAEEVALRNGRIHEVEILESTENSVTVRFSEKKASGTIKLHSRDMDPHSFYSIRNSAMEKTAQNHLMLAKFCAENGLFSRAKGQADKARALDAALVEKTLKMPGLIDGVAKKVLDSARKYFADGDLENAERYASVVLTEFSETPSSKKAGQLIDKIEGKVAEADEKQHQAAVDAAAKSESKANEALEKEVKPLRKAYEKARKLNIDGLKEKGGSKQVKMFETAAKTFESLLKKCDGLQKKYGDDEAVLVEIKRAHTALTQDAVEAWINAGSVDLARGSLKNARDYADRALSLDTSSSTARSFKARVEMAEANSDRWYRTRR